MPLMMAPLGDPMELNVRGYELPVRKAVAAVVFLLACRGPEHKAVQLSGMRTANA